MLFVIFSPQPCGDPQKLSRAPQVKNHCSSTVICIQLSPDTKRFKLPNCHTVQQKLLVQGEIHCDIETEVLVCIAEAQLSPGGST